MLHVLQSIIGYKIVYFYNFLDMLWLPGTARQTLVYSPGEFGTFFVLWFGLYFDRITFLLMRHQLTQSSILHYQFF